MKFTNRYLVSTSTSSQLPKIRDIEIHGDLLGTNGEWKRFELSLIAVDQDLVFTLVNQAIARFMPGYRIESWWEVM